jgi:ATP-binding cassette subfamily F protein 3
MSIIRLRNVTKRFDETQVLREVFFRLDPTERVGLIGRNGSGKTTLLRLILGQIEPDEGAVELDEGLKVGYFSQFSELNGALSISEVLRQVFADIQAIESELEGINTTLQSAVPGETPRLLARQAALFDEMERRDGWNYAFRIDTALTRLGFEAEDRDKPIEALSGGWRNRAALAKILLEQPDVLLLDEPTNFLDVAGLDWLEEWLKSFRGAVLVVSHDRDFIDHVATRIVELENYHLHEYPGNYQQYVQQRRLRARSLERQFEHEEELLLYESEAFADRLEARRDPKKALLRKLADIKKRVEPRPVDQIVTALYEQLRLPEALCRAERLGKVYGERVLFSDLTLEVQRGDRIAIIGPNGCGKTTLLRALAGQVDLDEGQVTWAKRADYAYFNDYMAALDPADNVSHAVNVLGMAYLAPRRQVNRFLNMLQFSEMDLKQSLGTLSGGQRARVALAQTLLSGAGVLLLDEPTNHLDITSIQVMERALVNFPGAMFVVSHDRLFIDKVAARLLLFEPGGAVKLFNGNWSLYQANLSLPPSEPEEDEEEIPKRSSW